jgi:soluble lytic murein transglycosylase
MARGFLTVLLASMVLLPAFAAPPPAPGESAVGEQRAAFLAARRALERGDRAGYERLAAGLDDYVLYPYLRYAELRRNLARADAAAIDEFLARYAGSTLAERLREAWLGRLAAAGRWDDFLAAYRPSGDTTLACHALTARLASGEGDSVWPDVATLWVVGKSQPTACDRPFAAWIEAGQLTAERVRERIARAIQAGEIGLTHYLEKLLPAAERHWVAHWRRVHARPATELGRLQPAADGSWSGRLFVSGVRRLASSDPARADRIWRSRGDGFVVAEDAAADAERAMALGLARERHPLGLQRLAALPAAWHTADTRHWRVRAALWQQDWPAVVAAIDAMTAEEQAEPDWVYWRARAAEQAGDLERAGVLYQAAAACRCFYGFLAAGRAGLPPTIDSSPLAVSEAELAAVLNAPALQRAHELREVGLLVDARREWRDGTADMDDEQLRAAAKLADLWGWHDQAILTLGRTDYLHDLELRFPTPYPEQVAAEAERRELDVAFIYAVMRQESAFYANARSPVGALGLMQLMPATAKRTARQIKTRVRDQHDILSVDTNIRLGTAHLRELMDRYRDNRMYVMAAYNAGPHRVTQWLPKEGVVPGDVWVAAVPFTETREYVKRIFAYTMIYEWRLGLEPTPVSLHLPDVLPKGSKPIRLSGDGEVTG